MNVFIKLQWIILILSLIALSTITVGFVKDLNVASIPWRFYQLYQNQALEVNCEANSMSVQPLDQHRVLILCGIGEKYR